MSRSSFCLLLCWSFFSGAPQVTAQEFATVESLTIEGAKKSLLSDEKDVWEEVPDYVAGATILRPENGNELRFTVKKNVEVLIVASWMYDGDASGDWYRTRTSQWQFLKQGWQVVGLMKKKAYQEPNLVFRKKLKAGEEVKLHTRKVNPPFILIPAADKLAEVPKTPAFQMAAHPLALVKPSVPGPAATAGKVVLLRATEPDQNELFDDRGVLIRELVRQAILLAAREELGLATRDETLHEYWSKGPADGPLPLDVIVSATQDHRVKVTFCRMKGMEAELLWDEEFQLPPEEDLLLALTNQSERFSRKELVAALRKAGFEGKANAVHDAKPVPEEISNAKLYLITQYAAARQLHQLIREEGESPERLVALAQVYSHLGILSEHFWYQGHKAFMARGLLYAQRAVARWPQSATARYAKSYVCGVIGLPAAALADLDAAAKLPGGEKPPEWMTGIESFCRYDSAKINELANGPKSLPKFLKLLMQEELQNPKEMLGVAEHILLDVADSDRAMDACYGSGLLDMCRYSAYQAQQTSAAVTLPACEKLPGLPVEAAKICRAESAARAGGDINEVAELQRRTDFIEAVRSSANTELEQAEPSWQVLATLVEETTFVQIVRVLDFQWSKLSVNTDESRTQMASAVPNHPAHAYIESFRGDPNLRREYLAQCIRQAREPDLSLTQMPVLRNIRAFALPGRDRYGNLMLMHEDAIVRDLYAGVSYAPDSMRVGLCSEWRRVSPHSPTPIALTIETDWDYAAQFAEEWAKKFSQSARVQLALGRRYFFDKKYPEAIRCLEKSASLDLNIDCSGLLANAWLAQKDENKWKQTWDKFLSEQHPGLLNSQAGVAVARYYMERERFEEALPYAETAANSYASWALTCAGDCLTGLKRYDEANKYFSANRNRYSPGGRVTWYYWQVRNNQGDLQKSLAGILDYLGDANTDAKIAPIDEANVLVLAGKKEQALKIYRQLVVKQPGTYTVWMTAILADDLHDSRNRDVAINMLAERSKLPDTKDYKGVKLAVLCQAALKDPVQLDALPKQMDELASSGDASERCLMFYLAGKFLANRGRRPEAEAMLRKAANHPFTVAESALAAQELRNWKKGETEGEKKTPEKKDGDQKE